MMFRIPQHLVKLSEQLNLSDAELALAYRKGFAAWKPGNVPGSTPEQLGLAVVEQFILIKQETLVEAQQDKLVDKKTAPVDDKNADPDPVDDPDSVASKAKDKKEVEKKPTSYKKFAKDKKYSNIQPGDMAPTGRSAAGAGGATFYQSEDVLPTNANIRAWAMSEKTQADYTKRYGEKASERLLEAAKKLDTSLNKIEETYVPPKDPKTKYPQGTREYADELLAHHKKLMDQFFGKDKVAYEFHKSASLQYVKKKEVAKSAFPYHDKAKTKERYDKVMKKR